MTMKVRVCKKCGHHNPVDTWSCANCGATLSVDTIIELDNSQSEEGGQQSTGTYRNSGYAERKEQMVQNPLILDLQRGNDQQRRASSYKLSKLKDPSIVPYLIIAYNDPDFGVRRNVVEGLRNIGTKEAKEYLNMTGPQKLL